MQIGANLTFQRLKRGEISGQIVVFIVLFMAVLVVFIAVVMNLGRIAELKTVVSLAADTGVLAMASGAGSYANALYHEALDEEEYRCVPSAWLGEVLKIVLAVIGFIFAFHTGGASLALSALGIALLIQGLSQKAENRAQIQERFNTMALEQSDQLRFVALALEAALAVAVNDPVMVTDEHDLDMDMVTDDKVSRYATVYEQKLYNELIHPGSTASQTTYSWQDNLGWHHVYVSVEAPWGFPYLQGYDPSIFKSCVRLAPDRNYCGKRGGGAGKVTVIRYDQDRDWLNFASGKRLWRFLFTYPGTAPVAPAPNNMANCEYRSDDGKAGLNCFGSNPLGNSPLTQGVKSTACAQWGPHTGYVLLLDCNNGLNSYQAILNDGAHNRPPCP